MIKLLWIKEEYLQQILDGRKTIEVRVGYSNIRKLKAGDTLLLNERYRYTIRRIASYDRFEDLLKSEDPARIAPEIEPGELLLAMRSIYPAEKEALGVIALEIFPERNG